MPRSRYSREEREYFEDLVNDITSNLETMSSEEFDDLYDQLPPEYQLKVDSIIQEFADDAIGSPMWRSDD